MKASITYTLPTSRDRPSTATARSKATPLLTAATGGGKAVAEPGGRGTGDLHGEAAPTRPASSLARAASTTPVRLSVAPAAGASAAVSPAAAVGSSSPAARTPGVQRSRSSASKREGGPPTDAVPAALAILRSPAYEAAGGGRGPADGTRAEDAVHDTVIKALLLDFESELNEYVAKYRYQLAGNGITATVSMCRSFVAQFFTPKLAAMRYRIVQVRPWGLRASAHPGKL